MGYLQAMEMANMADLEIGIQWQLRCNHYPPVPGEMIPVAVAAVEACREGDYEKFINTPIPHKEYWHDVPAHIIVDVFHLEPWCE